MCYDASQQLSACPRTNWRVLAGKAIGTNMVQMMEAEALATRMSWKPVGSSVWMSQLAGLIQNQID